MLPQSHYVFCAGREIHVSVWGEGNPETVVCWHGLVRTGRDFDILAEHLSRRFRVLCPDAPGRGLSQWAEEPAAEYCFTAYQRVALDLLAAFAVDRLRWVGSSMGGALGIRLAGGVLKDRMERLLVNDIGPQLPPPAVERILAYVGNPPAFDSMAELEAYLRLVYKPYGAMTDGEWRRMAETSCRRRDDGRLTLHYDPAVIRQFSDHPRDYDQWPGWEAITAPVLLLRGESSDLLPPDWAAEMTRRNSRTRLLEVKGCGHAPALNVPEQVDAVASFLE